MDREGEGGTADTSGEGGTADTWTKEASGVADFLGFLERCFFIGSYLLASGVLNSMSGDPSWVVGQVGELAGLAGFVCWRNHQVIFCLAPTLLLGTATFLQLFVSREGHVRDVS